MGKEHHHVGAKHPRGHIKYQRDWQQYRVDYGRTVSHVVVSIKNTRSKLKKTAIQNQKQPELKTH